MLLLKRECGDTSLETLEAALNRLTLPEVAAKVPRVMQPIGSFEIEPQLFLPNAIMSLS
jgi:hypothetical protein